MPALATITSGVPEVRHLPLCILLALLGSGPARAYRPFDGTDAAVADAGTFELELGPVGRVAERAQRSWLAPAVVANWGMGDERELVLEGKRGTAGGRSASNGERASLVDVALSLKQIHRRGMLQGESGDSVASECGLLLPGLYADHGLGGSCGLIVSG